ncbi:MAG: hypothetical protein OXC27_07805 [Caldilineaceae bacterium]|nr:hypothetical protein [Caldilineaceae bacterium]
MDLHTYPRPADDTGIGIHWCAGVGAAPPEMVEGFWLRELIELGIKWVKIADQREALQLAQTLLAGQIMPIVQLVREAPGPGLLSAAELDVVEELVEAGVRYFEFDSEPDRAAFWGQGRLPADALAVTAQTAAANMAAILERGGMPAIPALTPEGDWQLVEEIGRAGGDTLFDKPIWLAIHNYSSNRPPHYPEDAVHREGAPLAREFYLALAAEAWQGDSWQDRPLAEINDLRRELASLEDQPAADDDAPVDWRARLAAALKKPSAGQPQAELPAQGVHWRAFERLNSAAVGLIGRSLPILSTANGYLINESADPRYPATTPTLHMAQTLEICRAMMGTSRHTPPAPDYYFCTAFWLLAHEALQGEGAVDEQNAWYSPLHLAEGLEEEHGEGELLSLPGGRVPVPETFGWSTLPIVPLLKAEPKRPRGQEGHEESAPQAPVITARNGLRSTGEGVLSGKVRGGAGAHVRLTHSDGFAYESIARQSGVYRFVNLPAGRYSVEVTNPAGSRVDAIDLAPAQEAVRDLAAYGWGYEVEQRPVERGRVLTCNMELLPSDDARPPALRISDSEQKSWVVPLARSVEAQTAHCEVGPLPADSYRLEALGLPNSGTTPVQCQVPVDREMATHVLFVYSYDEKSSVPQESAVSGTVEGGKGGIVRLRAAEAGGGPSERFAEVDENGRYVFSGLPAGTYFVDVKQRRLLHCPRPLVLDGRNQPRCDLFLLAEEVLAPLPEPAFLQGETEPDTTAAPARQVTLLDAQGQRYVTQVEPSGAFRFDSLPAGDYDLYADGFGRRGFHLEAGDRLSIQLWQTEDGWSQHTRIRTAASASGMIYVQWVERPDLTVTVVGADGGEEEREAGEASETGTPYRAEFGPFRPGEYLVHCAELEISVEVALSADEAAVVTFMRGGVFGFW